MSRIQDDALIAYVDGELDPDWKAEVERSIAVDPAMAAAAAHHQALRDAAGQAYGGVLGEPIPERLLRAAGSVGERRVASPDAPFDPRRGRRAFGLVHVGVMAACLALGGVAGKLLPLTRASGEGSAAISGPGPLAADGAGRLEARGSLLKALNSQLSAEEGDGKVRLGFSFRATDGAFCRTFQMSEVALAGLACRDGGRWAVRVTTPGHADAHEDQTYRLAASPMPPSILVAVDSIIDGAPLDRGAEEAARDRNWVD
jgi:hypothetical protein